MKKFIFLIFIAFIFIWQGCNSEAITPEINAPESSIRLKLVDYSYNDIIKQMNGGFRDTIEFYYLIGTEKKKLNFTIYWYDIPGFIVDVKRIPELSSSGIKNFYLRFNSCPIDSLYLDIRQKSDLYYTSEWFDYIELNCNGIPMEYNDRYIFYFIKKRMK